MWFLKAPSLADAQALQASGAAGTGAVLNHRDGPDFCRHVSGMRLQLTKTPTHTEVLPRADMPMLAQSCMTEVSSVLINVAAATPQNAQPIGGHTQALPEVGVARPLHMYILANHPHRVSVWRASTAMRCVPRRVSKMRCSNSAVTQHRF